MFLSADQFLGYVPSSVEWTVWVVKLPPGANSHTSPLVPKNSRHAPSASMPTEAPIASTSALRISGAAWRPSDALAIRDLIRSRNRILFLKQQNQQLILSM